MTAYTYRLWRLYWLAVARRDLIGQYGIAARLRKEMP
jgi:hypothetical protein